MKICIGRDKSGFYIFCPGNEFQKRYFNPLSSRSKMSALRSLKISWNRFF